MRFFCCIVSLMDFIYSSLQEKKNTKGQLMSIYICMNVLNQFFFLLSPRFFNTKSVTLTTDD